MTARDVKTVTVIGCKAVSRPDGRVAIYFETQELGPIAFEVNQQSIGWLRQTLAVAETHLQLSQNQTRN